MAKIRNITDPNGKWINAEVAQRALSLINSACSQDDAINQNGTIGAAVRTLQDGLRSDGEVVAPSGKRITQQQADFDESELATVLAALRMFQRKYEDQPAEVIWRDWPDHFTVSERNANAGENGMIEPLGTEDIGNLCERINCGEMLTAANLSADDWAEIFYALEDKLKSPTLRGDDHETRRWRTHLHRILKTIGPDGELAAQSE